MAVTTFFGAAHIDLSRRHSHMSQMGDIIHYLVLEGPHNALAWLRARRVIVSVGHPYLERIGYFVFASGAMFLYMFGWSVAEGSRPAEKPLTRSYPLFLILTIFYQISILLSIREAGLANSSSKKHAYEWCQIRTQLLEEMSVIQECIDRRPLEKQNLQASEDTMKPTNRKTTNTRRRRPRRLSVNYTNKKSSNDQRMAMSRRTTEDYYASADNLQLHSDAKRLKAVELAVSSCIDELKILNLSYQLSIHKVPITMALFRALVGIFYTQMYLLLVYTLRILESKA